MCSPLEHDHGLVQANEELEALKELNKARRNLAFGSAQADIDEKFRQMSSELKASRERMEVPVFRLM